MLAVPLKRKTSFNVFSNIAGYRGLRVLLVHNNYAVQGGAEVFVREVARVLEENGHEIAYFCADQTDEDVVGADFFVKAPDYQSSPVLDKIRNLPKFIYNRTAKERMSALIADFKPDVVHTFAIYVRLTPAVLEAAKEHGVPVALSCNDYKHLCPNYKLFHHGRVCDDCKGGRFYKSFTNNCCRESRSVSFVSMLEGYAHEYLDIWRKNVSTFLFASVFMAEKTEDFWGKGRVNIEMLRNPFGVANNYVAPQAGDYVLFFGRLIQEKGAGSVARCRSLGA